MSHSFPTSSEAKGSPATMLPDFGKIFCRIRDTLSIPNGEGRRLTTSAMAFMAVLTVFAFGTGITLGSLGKYPSVNDMVHIQMIVRKLSADSRQCRADLEAARQQSAAIKLSAEAAAEQLTACLTEIHQ